MKHANHDWYVEKLVKAQRVQDIGFLKSLKADLRKMPKDQADAIMDEFRSKYKRNPTMARKKKRSAAQIAATKKLVALNKKRRGKKKATRKKATRRRTVKKKTIRRARRPAKKKVTKRNPSSRYYQIFKCKGHDVRFLALTTDGKIRWTLTRGDTVRWSSKAEAAKIARRLAKGRKLAGFYVGVASSSTTATAISNECIGARIVGKA